jgi:deoxyribodipyrimidine photolyase-related protein
VLRDFPDAPGSGAELWLPIHRDGALAWLEAFVSQRFAEFGPYEDSLADQHDLLFHSALSPLLNAGLLLPREALGAVMDAPEIPLNSREGFVRQLIGWREFMRLVYHQHGRTQRSANALGFTREMPQAFYTGNTGLPPFDAAVHKVLRLGWLHHIERLMVVGNLMFLCGIHPDAVYRWFMELFLDAWDWVMVPNVYGMIQYSDGGLITTKPYLSGSSYLRKMGAASGDWTDTWDGLYWRFVSEHRELFAANPRLAVMTRALDRLKPDRRARIFRAADTFLARHWGH